MSLAASELRDSLARGTLTPPPGISPDETPHRASAAALATSLAQLAGQAAATPSAASLAMPMRAQAEQADGLASAWTGAAESLRASAGECQTLCATAEQERTAIPDVVSPAGSPGQRHGGHHRACPRASQARNPGRRGDSSPRAGQCQR